MRNDIMHVQMVILNSQISIIEYTEWVKAAIIAV